MISPLENMTGSGKSLAKEPADDRESQGLIRSGLARLRDAANPENSLEGRFDLVYNAAHALSLAALRWHGFRPANRYIVSRSVSVLKSGAYWPRDTKSVISVNTRVN